MKPSSSFHNLRTVFRRFMRFITSRDFYRESTGRSLACFGRPSESKRTRNDVDRLWMGLFLLRLASRGHQKLAWPGRLSRWQTRFNRRAPMLKLGIKAFTSVRQPSSARNNRAAPPPPATSKHCLRKRLPHRCQFRLNSRPIESKPPIENAYSARLFRAAIFRADAQSAARSRERSPLRTFASADCGNERRGPTLRTRTIRSTGGPRRIYKSSCRRVRIYEFVAVNCGCQMYRIVLLAPLSPENPYFQCRGRDLNPHGAFAPEDFKSPKSVYNCSKSLRF